MSVYLRKRKNSDGTTSLYLDIYHGSKRNYEFLTDLKLSASNSPQDRQKNKENLALAKTIAIKKAQELASNGYNVQTEHARKVSLLSWMQSYIDGYKQSDIRNMKGAVGKFKLYLESKKETHLLIKDLDENRVMQYREYLSLTCEGEGAKSYFARFKKMIRQAVREKLILVNPCAEVKAPKGEARTKDTLTFEELQILANTDTRATEVKRAFLFSCVTGLRWADVKALTWANADLRNNVLKVPQTKTEKTVTLNLTDTALQLLGKAGKPKEKIFELPSANGANKALAAWLSRAEIPKKITWHCARHSFGTNLLFHGADVFVTSKLLGHTSLKHTQRYVRAAEDMKRDALNKFPKIQL